MLIHRVFDFALPWIVSADFFCAASTSAVFQPLHAVVVAGALFLAISAHKAMHFPSQLCWLLSLSCGAAFVAWRLVYFVPLAARFYFGPPFGSKDEEARVLRLGNLAGTSPVAVREKLDRFFEGHTGLPQQTTVLQRKDGTWSGVAHLTFKCASSAAAAASLNWAAVQTMPLEVSRISCSPAFDEERKITGTRKRTAVEDLVQRAGAKMLKGIDAPWSYTVTKQVSEAIVSDAKKYEGRPADQMPNVEVGHELAFRYNRHRSKPRIVCKVQETKYFTNTRQMLRELGWQRFVPWVQSEAAAESEYGKKGKEYNGAMKAFKIEYLRTEEAE